MHATWFLENVYGSRVTSCYAGTLLFNLRWCILFISIFIMLTNVDTLIILYFYVFRWKLKNMKIINAIIKTFLQIAQVMEVAWALTVVPVKNVDQYIWISMQVVVFFWNNCLWKLDILFNVMDIVSQLKDKGLQITFPFCMTMSLLFIYNKIHFNLFYCIVQCLYENVTPLIKCMDD